MPRSSATCSKSADMVHVDTGASFNHHSADIQRNVPVAGKFTRGAAQALRDRAQRAKDRDLANQAGRHLVGAARPRRADAARRRRLRPVLHATASATSSAWRSTTRATTTAAAGRHGALDRAGRRAARRPPRCVRRRCDRDRHRARLDQPSRSPSRSPRSRPCCSGQAASTRSWQAAAHDRRSERLRRSRGTRPAACRGETGEIGLGGASRLVKADISRAGVLMILVVLAPVARGDQSGVPPALASSVAVEQTSQGSRAALPVLESFDGLGAGFAVAQRAAAGQGGAAGAGPRNPSDNSLAVGPDHIVQTVNSRWRSSRRRGSDSTRPAGRSTARVRPTRSSPGFGGVVRQSRNNGDAVVRYDQLADRWLSSCRSSGAP